MAECIIARGGGRSDGGSPDVPIVADKHTILVTVRDADGVVLNDLSVHCKDGDLWYNYHTNDKGQVLFVTNSGSANITTWNASINGRYKWFDLSTNTINIDAPVGLSSTLNINLSYVSSFSRSAISNSNVLNSYYSGAYRFRHSNYANINMISGGGGGGGGVDYKIFNTNGNYVSWMLNSWNSPYGGGGGGGGAWKIVNNISVNRNYNYFVYTGSGGRGGRSGNDNGRTGGTTSALGYSVYGGSGGTYTGIGGTGASSDRDSKTTLLYNGGNGGNVETNGYDSENNLGFGGGAGAITWLNRNNIDKLYGGNKNGANINSLTWGGRSVTGYGGGGGGGVSSAQALYNSSNGTWYGISEHHVNGGNGGNGRLSIHFRR